VVGRRAGGREGLREAGQEGGDSRMRTCRKIEIQKDRHREIDRDTHRDKSRSGIGHGKSEVQILIMQNYTDKQK
jgi:hypothetical protein